jgi:hypothetical protein
MGLATQAGKYDGAVAGIATGKNGVSLLNARTNQINFRKLIM